MLNEKLKQLIGNHLINAQADPDIIEAECELTDRQLDDIAGGGCVGFACGAYHVIEK